MHKIYFNLFFNIDNSYQICQNLAFRLQYTLLANSDCNYTLGLIILNIISKVY